ncbi:MAG: peptidylprolyl isomerase [Candidatus Moraniibacteriota bacterium]
MKIRLPQRIKTTTLTIGIFTFLVAFFVILGAAYYLWPSSRLTSKIAKVLPFPVASIGVSEIITTKSLGENMTSIRRFYETQDFGKAGMRIDFSTEDGQRRLKLREKDLLNKMLEDRAIERLAREQGIVVTPAEAQKGVEGKLKELGTGSQVEQSLARLYGWTLSDFGEKVVLPSLYEEKLLEKFQSEDNGKKAARERIDKAEQALKGKRDFATVAGEFSEGRTAAEGGELGWFTLDDLAPDLQDPVKTTKEKVPTRIIESELGYHILLVEESKFEEGKRLYHLRQIFNRKPSFAEWLTGKMREMPIHVFSREYEWDVATAEMRFRDKELQEFERKLLEKAEGDPTLLL